MTGVSGRQRWALVRVDDRLLHGQVILGWLRALPADCVLVADDALAQDDLMSRFEASAVPAGYTVRVSSIATAAAWGAGLDARRASRTVVLLRSPAAAAELQAQGFPLDELNLGCLGRSGVRKHVSSQVWLSDEETRMLDLLMQRGVRVYLQALPSQPQTRLKPPSQTARSASA